MKIPINEAAVQLHLHPCELVLEFATKVSSFDDIYPEIDEGFIKTYKECHPDKFFKSPRESNTSKEPRRKDLPEISEDAKQLLTVLVHKKYWGTRIISKDTLKNHYCRDIKNLDSAIQILLKAKLLQHGKHRDSYNLDLKAKKTINAIVSESAE